MLPTIKEQESIGKLLHILDKNIESIQSKINLLTKLKTAYLHKMFL